ncbi:MAG: GGDEF domain-containing phosphodiesterase [Devosia sp.]
MRRKPLPEAVSAKPGPNEASSLPEAVLKLAHLSRDAATLIGRYDHVTRLPNRLQFLEDFAAQAFAGSARRVLTLVTLAEARHYNEILRALGHAFADNFVRAGADKLRNLLPSDLPIYHVSVLSFAFIMDHDGYIPPIAAKIADAFDGDIRVDDIPIKTKVGVGLLPLEQATEPSEALRAALAAAQDSRRTEMGLAFYNNMTDAAHLRAFRLLTDLPAALRDRSQLSLAFQPRIDLRSGTACGAEALLRWNHPQLGSISPGEFVPLAEQTSLIEPLTQWVLDSALAEARRLKDAGRRLRISINASPNSLAELAFDERLLRLCTTYGVTPDQIELEFTEGMLAGNQDRAMRQLARLRNAGIEIAIDDFGTGFANFSHLSAIPADILKIDQSFIRPLAAGKDFLVRHILEIAKGLGFRVCAEGIETAESYALLQAMDCDEGQGYFMARPMPAAALLHWSYGTNPLPK